MARSNISNLGRSEQQPPLTREGIKPILLSLTIGAAGGFVFTLLAVPLAWMLGPMVVNMIASVKGVPVLIPHNGRVLMLCIIGVFLGGSFSPELLERVGEWLLSLSLMVVFIPLVTVLAGMYYWRFAGFSRTTAMLSGAPGTLTAMIMVGSEVGADERMIALTQGLRVAIIVFLMPMIVALAVSKGSASSSFLPEGGPFLRLDLLLLATAGFFGFGMAWVLKLPASAMTGAMLTSAVLYLGDIVHWRPPNAVLLVCLWVLGSAIGSRFSTVTASTFFRVSRHAAAVTAMLVILTAMFSFAVSKLTGVQFLTTFLSFMPGGVAEMCLIAIAFDIDPAFVAVHHLLRIAVLITLAPFAAKWVSSYFT